MASHTPVFVNATVNKHLQPQSWQENRIIYNVSTQYPGKDPGGQRPGIHEIAPY